MCTHLYSIDSFEKCASSSNTCNLSILIDSYLRYRTCIMESPLSDANSVVFDAVNGLGNRVFGLMAVTTYALLTGRVLFVHWQPGDNHHAYFDDLFSPIFPSSSPSLFSRFSISRGVHLLKYRWNNEIQGKTPANRLPKDWSFYFDREYLCNERADRDRWFERAGIDLLNWIGRSITWIRTDQYFVPLFTRNAKYKPAFKQLVPDGQLFAELARRLLHPAPKVQMIIDEFRKRSAFQNDLLTVGVHMRSWSSMLTDHIEPFQKCIEHVLLNLTRAHYSTENKPPRSTQAGMRLGLYIISNTPKRRQHLEHRLAEIYPNLTILHSPTPTSTADEREKMQYTLAELLLLSQMKHLIVTSKSTFGMVAQGFARRGAWVVRQDISAMQSDLCQWESSSEPEYQMMGELRKDDQCIQQGVLFPSLGERTVL